MQRELSQATMHHQALQHGPPNRMHSKVSKNIEMPCEGCGPQRDAEAEGVGPGCSISPKKRWLGQVSQHPMTMLS